MDFEFIALDRLVGQSDSRVCPSLLSSVLPLQICVSVTFHGTELRSCVYTANICSLQYILD